MRPFFFGLLLALALPAFAGAEQRLVLDGNFIQGGLLYGATEPGTQVTFDGRRLSVSEAGGFIVGFGRKAPATAALSARYPDGSEEVRLLDIAARDYDVQRIDGLPRQMVTPPDAVLARIRAEAERIKNVRANDGAEPFYLSGFRWPALGRISGVYGSQRILNGEPRQPHYGIDIAVPAGTPVTAPADGIVTLVERDLYFTGGTVIVDHGHGLTSAFLHLQEIGVAAGQRVTQGAQIATVGSTGRSTGPHLDWRVNWFEERLDPALLAGPMPAAQAKP